jgi:hypothetical protein
MVKCEFDQDFEEDGENNYEQADEASHAESYLRCSSDPSTTVHANSPACAWSMDWLGKIPG